MTQTENLPDAFVQKLGSGMQLGDLFEFLPELYWYVKDDRSRFVKANGPLHRLLGLDSEEGIIGRTDFDFFPRHLAEQYVAEDQRVMDGAAAIPNQVWLVPVREGGLKWFQSTKIPLRGTAGAVIGLAGVMRDLEKTESVVRPYQEMDEVIRHVLQHFPERIEIGQLARKAHLSISQFERRFKRLFQMTPQEYILRVRINAARQLLTSGQASMSEIAQDTGFYDQSYFTKQFRRQMGLTPRAYRRKYASG
jgi:PAS domain S-box-containing protein